MSIKITDNFRLRSNIFLDNRVEVSSTNALKNWNFNANPLPPGFEVCLVTSNSVKGVWYIYDPTKINEQEDPVTGRFVLRETGGSGDAEFATGQAVSTVSISNSSSLSGSDNLFTGNAIAEYVAEHGGSGGGEDAEFASGEKVDTVSLTSSSSDIASGNTKVPKGGAIYTALSEKQNNLVSGQNIKTLNGNTLLGPGNINTTFATDELLGDISLSSDPITSSTSTLPTSKAVYNQIQSHYIDTFAKLKLASTWTGIGGVKKGMVVNVTSDTDPLKNGTWYLLSEEDYTEDEGWKKILDRNNTNVGVGNYLRNTSFLGDANYEYRGQNNNLNVYSDPKKHWTGSFDVFVDTNSFSGYSAELSSTSVVGLKQTIQPIDQGEVVTVTWKQTGKIKIVFGGSTEATRYTWENETKTGVYEYYAETVTLKAAANDFKAYGIGKICEIKVALGDVPTTWSPSILDNGEIPDRINELGYLRTALGEYSVGENVTGINLRSAILAGENTITQNPGTQEIITTLTPLAGVSGSYSQGSDSFIWTGGNIAKAQALVNNVDLNPNYLETAPESELGNLAKSVLTFSDYSIFTDIIAKGRFYDLYTGQRLSGTTQYGLSGVHPVKCKVNSDSAEYTLRYVKFINGRIADIVLPGDVISQQIVNWETFKLFQWAGLDSRDKLFSGELELPDYSEIYNPLTGNKINAIKFLFQSGILIKTYSSANEEVGTTQGLTCIVLNHRVVDEKNSVITLVDGDEDVSLLIFYSGQLVKVHLDNEISSIRTGLFLY